MSGALPGRKRRFHAPVVASYAGVGGVTPVLSQHLATLPPSSLGSAAEVFAPGSNCRSVDATWDARVRNNRRRRHPAGASSSADCGASSNIGEPGPNKRVRVHPRRSTPVFDDDCGEPNVPCAPPGGRVARGKRPPLVSKEVMDALSACVLRACGRPSTTLVGKGKTAVSATLLGDPNSRSRAIFLRLGTGRHEQAVLWSSNRGGLLCSCFTGTQNALFLSVSSRSSVCRHSSALLSCLSTARIPLAEFWQRMHLGAAPKDFVRRAPHGSSSWLVLFRSVYSLVSFTPANVAACITPSCRRFRARCGHVKLARPFNAELRSKVAVAVKERGSSAPKAAPAGDGAGLHGGVPEDDAGIEKEPGDTVRDGGDAAEATVALRVRRNLLPCVGEIAAGEVWARTADWKGMIAARCAGGRDGRAADLKGMSNLFDKCAKSGLVHENGFVSVEPYCGSCGRKREERHEVTKEAAVLYTHHPSAPAMRVSHCCWCL